MIAKAPVTGFPHLEGHNYCLITTYRANGEPVPTPVWFVAEGDGVLVCTDDPCGKVRRLRRDPRVAVAPCTCRGRSRGNDVPGRATVLDGPSAERAKQTMDRSYSLGKRLFYRVVHPIVARGKTTVFLRIQSASES